MRKNEVIKLDKEYINQAIELSKEADFPYGAIIVKDNKIIGSSNMNTPVTKSAFAHAELKAIENAIENLGGYLCAEGGKGATIYSSCEPCAMCMGAILYTGIDRLVYAATLEDSMKAVNDILVKADKVANACSNRAIEIVHELEREKAVKVIEDWGKINNN